MKTDRLSRPQIWALLSAASATGAVAAGFSFVGPVMVLLLEQRTGSGAFIGFFATMGAITTVMLTPIAPKLMARFSAPLLIASGCILGGLSFLLYPLAENVEWWFAIRWLQGMFLTLVFIVGETWINSTAPERMRGRILGAYAIFLAGGLGLGAGAAALMINLRGLEGSLPFLIGAGLTLAGILPLLARRHMAMERPSAHGARLSTMFEIVRGSPGLMATGIAFGAIEFSLYHLLPVFGVRSGYEEGAAALLLLALPLGNIVLQYPIGMLADRLPRGKVLAWMFAACVVIPLVCAAVKGSYSLLIIGFAAFTGIATGLYTLGLAMLSEKHKGDNMAAANSAFILMYGVGSLISPVLIGVAMDGVGPNGMMGVLAGIAAVAFVAFVRAERRVGAVARG